MSKKQAFQQGIQAGIPIGLGYFAVSFTFGMMAVSGGLTTLEAGLISLTTLTSAGQFAGLQIILSSGTYFELVLSQIIINLRYLLMSFSLSQKLDRSEPWAFRYAVAFGVTDEIFGVSASQPGKVSAFFNFGAMCVAIPGWTIGTVVGGILGGLLPAYLVSALSVAIYGMFLAVFIPPAKHDKAVMLAVIGAMALSSAFAVVPLLQRVSSGFVIIITTVTVSAVAAWLAPIKEETQEEDHE